MKRRQKVLDDMLDQGYISQQEYDQAMTDDVYSRIQIADSENEDSAVNTYFVDALTHDRFFIQFDILIGFLLGSVDQVIGCGAVLTPSIHISWMH